MAQPPTAEHATITHPRPVEHVHPSPAEYVKIAIILAIVTAAEVALYYIEQAGGIPDTALVVTLIVMSALKFFLVAMWFMHLKFDAKIFRRLFIAGIVLATAVYLVVLVSFRVLTPLVDLISRIGG